MKVIIVVSAGTSGPDETLQWAGSGPRAVICPPLSLTFIEKKIQKNEVEKINNVTTEKEEKNKRPSKGVSRQIYMIDRP